MAAFVELILPRNLSVEALTKPISFVGDGTADGIEAYVKTRDFAGDPIKSVGTFHVELYTARQASADKLGRRLALWPVEVKAERDFTEYWDRFGRFFRFSLKLTEAPLPPGRYVLNAWLLLPNGEKIFAEYEFSYDGSPVSTVAPLIGRSR